MKKQIVQIATELKLGDITTNQAKEALLSLFGVSSSYSCKNCEPNEIDITRCPECNSSDHTMNKPYRCMDCGFKW
jgi:predicted RNA-binding Zn-ribbon protein involved in translation (DUF1610 family)